MEGMSIGLRKVDYFDGAEIPKRSEILAAVYCPFPLTINGHAGAAERESLDWLSNLGIAVGQQRLASLARAHLTTLVAGFYPSTGLEQLRLASDYVCWAFALDDIGDETEVGGRPARLMELFELFDQVLQGTTPSASATPLELGLHDVLQRFSKYASAQQMYEFVEGNRAYFGGMIWEANNRASSWVPDETAYMAFRPAAGAVPSFFALIEPLERIVLSPHVRAHDDVRALAQLAGIIICCTNDLLSYEKERAHRECHNLIMVYEHHRKLAPGAAARQAIGFINAATHDFIRQAAKPPTFEAEQNAELERYIDTLRSIIRVTLSWTYDSTRYSGG
jgi:hypothetical protein